MGALQHVVRAYDNGVFCDEAESRLIKFCCKRNEALPNLVAKAGLSLLPMLFESAKQAWRTAPNAILIALLAAGDSIGPR